MKQIKQVTVYGDLKKSPGEQRQKRNCDQIHQHEGYNAELPRAVKNDAAPNDIAIIILDNNFDANSQFAPVKITDVQAVENLTECSIRK